MARRASLALGGLALLGAAATVAFFLFARPRRPDLPDAEIERRWADVIAQSEVDGPIGLEPLATILGRSGLPRELSDAVYWAPAAPVPVVPIDDVPWETRHHIDRLLEWGRHPRFGGDCTVPAPVFHARKLLRLALATADATQVERAHAALSAATAMRGRGGLLVALLGLELADDVARWAVTRGVPAWPELAQAGATPAEFVRVFGRQMVCTADAVALAIREAEAEGQDARLLRDALATLKVDAYDRMLPLRDAQASFEVLRGALTSLPTPSDPVLKPLFIDPGDKLSAFEEQAAAHDVAMAALAGMAPR
ncbi:MAG: hypothetical protein H6706_19525 [Myxococcales bacterium]|nr:hypothetical protein [Myxococcales bacterium]